MTYPWETPATAPERKSPASTGWAIPFAVLAFFLGSYFPWQPYDFSKFGDKQPEVVSLEKGSWVLVVEETEDRSKFPWLATIQADADFWEGLKKKGVNWGFYDIQSGDVAEYKQDALSVGLPALLVITPHGNSGRVRIAKSCPPTTQAISEMLGGVR